ncbi:MAG TPA: ATP-binding cassette domain-containing protein [Clostridiaceae bacterium]|nr:ATP-binding cassette domain-containing protein [Clostridiaceae bacterium]
MALIEVKDLSKEYKISEHTSQQVLKGVDLAMDRGEFIAVIGESGSGKSTLLNIIGGLDSDYKGSVRIRGRDLKDFTEKELDDYRKLNIGFVFQSFNLIPTYTVFENILVPADMTTMPEKIKKEKAYKLISRLGLAGLEDKMPSSLSGGEKQRVAIARALMNDPDIILADEPTGALDKKNAENIITLLKSIAAEGKLVVVVTHSPKVANQCNRIVRIEYGTISHDSGISVKSYTEDKKETGGITSRSLGILRSFSTAYKNIRKNKLRNILVSLGTGIGIFSVVALMFLSKGIGNYITNQMYSQTNPLLIEITKQGVSDIANRRYTSFANLEPFDDGDLKQLSEIAGVVSVEKGSIIIGSTTLSVENRKENIAVLSTLNSSFSQDIKTGSLPGKGEILISESVADAICVDYTELIGKKAALTIRNDDTQEVINEKAFTISGIVENDGSAASRLKTVHVNFEDIAGTNGGKDTLPVNILHLTASSQDNVDFIKSEVTRLGFNINSRDSAIKRIISFIDTVSAGLTGVAAVSLVVSGIMILVILFISVVERTKEIGTLRAIGARAADIRRIFLSEGTLLGIGSGITGILIAVIVSGATNRILYRITGTKLIAINLPNIFTGILISVGISTLASLIPAAKASRLDPVESLRHE